MLEKGNQRCRYRYELFRTDVNVINVSAIHEDEVAGLAGVDQISHDAALVVEFNVGLGNHVAIFFPRRLIERKGLEIHLPLLAVF